MKLTDAIPGDMLWPFGEATKETPAYAAAVEVTLKNRMTIIEPSQLSGNMTLTLTKSAEQRVGDMVVLKIATAGTQTLTLAGDVVAPNFSGVAGKTKVQKLIFDGTNFVAESVAFQID